LNNNLFFDTNKNESNKQISEGDMKKVDIIAMLLLIFAGINWGLWGLFEFNLVYYVFGADWIDRVIYVLLGVSAVYMAVVWRDFGIRWATRNKRKK